MTRDQRLLLEQFGIGAIILAGGRASIVYVIEDGGAPPPAPA
jgi:hypothetical protein